jgi:GAF domain-containing protein
VLIEHGGDGKTFFAVLEVDSPDPGQFDQADADILAGFAGLLGIAIERQQADAKLQEALEHQALLTREMSHRVKNSLTSVASLLRVQARTPNPTMSRPPCPISSSDRRGRLGKVHSS